MLGDMERERSPNSGELSSLNAIVTAHDAIAAVVSLDGRVCAVNDAWLEKLENFADCTLFAPLKASWPSEAGDQALLVSLQTALSDVATQKKSSFLDRIHLPERHLDADVHLSLLQLPAHKAYVLVTVRLSEAANQVRAQNTAAGGIGQEHFFDAINQAIVIRDVQGCIRFCNPAARKILAIDAKADDFSVSEYLDTHAIYPSGEPCPSEHQPAQIALATGKPVDGFKMGLQRDGGEVDWISLSACPVFGPDSGTPSYTVTTFFDMTHERTRERELKKASERLQMALQAGDVGIWEYDLASKRLFLDDASLGIFKIDSDQFDLTVSDWKRCLHADDLDSSVGMMERAIGDQTDINLEYRIVWPDKEIRHISSRAKIHFDDHGKPAFFVGTHVDMTARRRSELELIHRSIELEQVSDRLQLAVDLDAVGVWYWDMKEDILIWDDSVYKLFGLKSSDYSSAKEAWAAVIHPEDKRAQALAMLRARKTSSKVTTEFRIIRPNGEERYILANVKLQATARGDATLIAGVNRDVTLEKQAELKIKANQDRLQNILQNLPVGTVYIEKDRVDINAKAEEITGYEKDDLNTLNLWFRRLFSDKQEQMANYYRRIRSKPKLVSPMVMSIARSDNKTRWIEFRGCKIEAGEAWIMKDITEQRATEHELRNLAYFDLVTDLPNRGATEKHLEQAIQRAERDQRKLAVLLIDLDHFKNVNDTFGHPAGDELLRAVAARLRARAANSDFLGRIGGDEFMLIIDDPSCDESLLLSAQDMVDAFSSVFALQENVVISARATVGVSVFPEHGRDAVTLFRNADTALYQAKAQGRQTFQLYTPSLTRALEQRLTLEQRMELALQNENFQVNYQPILDAQTQSIIGAEALLRWIDPELGFVSPADFIPIAEECGLISPIGRWVLIKACSQMANWLKMGINLKSMSVNLSGAQFGQDDLFEQITDVLHQTGLNPRHLTLEITENTLMYDKTNTKHALLKLRGIGVQLAIDDFGTGYSSLAYLKYFAVNSLKIDRSFIRDIPADFNDAQITSAIISMARNLNLGVVAEGIETEEQLKFIQDNACHSFQGFLVSPAVPAEDFAALFHSHSINKP